MPALLRFPILFVVAFLFAHPALTQIIGGRGNGQNAPAEVKASEVSAGGFSGNVSLFTGTYNSSYNLGTVTEPSGLSFTATMTYSSAFSAGDNQPFVSGVPYGEGWNVDIPTISVTTEDFSKYTKLQLESINSANSAPFTPSFSANEQQREGDIFWFSPSLNIPGVASGRLVYKYMEASDRVFVLHEFERYVEARMIDGGYTWEVILDDGTRYEFRKAMINVSNAPNQRVPTLNLAGPEGRSLALPKTSFVKWVCTKVYHRNKTGNIQFLYDSYGCFDFFQELNQSTLNNNLQTQWGTADQIARWKPCRELVIKEIFSATEKLVFGYKTVFFSGANNSGMLQLTDPAVLRTDSMYSYKTVNSWTSSFANWARYRHIKAHNQNANFSNGTNPYLGQLNIGIDTKAYLSRTLVQTAGSLDFDHGFLESPNIAMSGLPSGELYEVKTQIQKTGGTGAATDYCLFDINIASGTNYNTAGAPFPSTFNTHLVDADLYTKYRGTSVFSTFNQGFKWYYYPGGILQTSNFFMMPNLAPTFKDIFIQVGPANSDNEYAMPPNKICGISPAVPPKPLLSYYNDGTWHTNWDNNNNPMQSGDPIPANFGIGMPWYMLQKIYGANNDYTGNTPTKFWWNVSPPGTLNYENQPTRTKGAGTTPPKLTLIRADLVRHTKNAYMLTTVSKYVNNPGYTAAQFFDQGQWHLTGQLKLEYELEQIQIYANAKTPSTNMPPNNDKLKTYTTPIKYRKVIKLARIRQMNIKTNSGNVPESEFPTTHFTYQLITTPALSSAVNCVFTAGVNECDGTMYNSSSLVLWKINDPLGRETEIEYYNFGNSGLYSGFNPPANATERSYTLLSYHQNPYPFTPNLLNGSGVNTTDMRAQTEPYAFQNYMVVKSVKVKDQTAAVQSTDYSYGRLILNYDAPVLGGNLHKDRETDLRVSGGFDSCVVLGPARGTKRVKSVYYHRTYETGGVNLLANQYYDNLMWGKLYKVSVYDGDGKISEQTEVDYDAVLAYEPLRHRGYDLIGTASDYDYAEYDAGLAKPILSDFTSHTAWSTYVNSLHCYYELPANNHNDPGTGPCPQAIGAFYGPAIQRNFANPVAGQGANEMSYFLEATDYLAGDDRFYLNSYFIRKKSEKKRLYDTELTTTSFTPAAAQKYLETITDYQYFDADYRGKSTSEGYGKIGLTASAGVYSLYWEPSWQVYSKKTYSPHLADAYTLEEYFYFFDLPNVGSYQTAPAQFKFYPKIAAGTQYRMLYDIWAWKQIRNLAYQARITTKAPSEPAVVKSSYFIYRNDWETFREPSTYEYVENPNMPADCNGLPGGDPVVPGGGNDDPPTIPSCVIVVPGNSVPAGYCPMPSAVTPNRYCLCGVSTPVPVSPDPPQPPFGRPAGSSEPELRPRHGNETEITSARPPVLPANPYDDPSYRHVASIAGLVLLKYETVWVKDSNAALMTFDPTTFVYKFNSVTDTLNVYNVISRNIYGQVVREADERNTITYFNYGQIHNIEFWNCYNGLASLDHIPLNNHPGFPDAVTVGEGRPDAQTTSYTYNADLTIASVTGPNNMVMSYTYDMYGRMSQASRNGALLQAITYSQWKNNTSKTFQQRLDENFVKTENYLESNVKWTEWAYLDPLGRKAGVKKELAAGTSYILGNTFYDTWNQASQQRKAFASTSTPAVTVPVGVPTNDLISFEYDAEPASRITKSAKYGQTLSGNTVQNAYGIISSTTLSAVLSGLSFTGVTVPGTWFLYQRTTDEDGKYVIEILNAFGQKVLSLGLNGQAATVYKYNSHGQVKLVINPNKHSSQYNFNHLGQLYHTLTPDDGATYFVYDESGLVLARKDARNITRLFAYDAYGRPAGQIRKTTLTTAENNALYAAKGTFWVNNRDLSNYTSLWNNNYHWEKQWYYNTVQSTLLTTYGTTNIQNYVNNGTTFSLGKPTMIMTYGSAGTLNEIRYLSYTAEGFLKWEINQFNFNNLTSLSKGMALAILYPEYNLAGSVKTQNIDLDCDGVLDFQYYNEYDAWNRLLRTYANFSDTKNTGSKIVELLYDNIAGAVDKKTYFDQLSGCTNVQVDQIDYDYDARFRLTRMASTLFDYDLKYDAGFFSGFTTNLTNNYNGNINAAKAYYKLNLTTANPAVFAGTQNTNHWNYTYDNLNRLTKADGNISGTANWGDSEYTYDKAGNISTLKRYSYDYNGTLQQDVFTFNYTANTNRLASVTRAGVTDRSIGYDANGNMTSDTKRKVTAVNYGRMNLPFSQTVNINATTNKDVSMLYDISDTRIQKRTVTTIGNTNPPNSTVNGSEYYIHTLGGREIGTYDFLADKLTWYVFAGERVAKIEHIPASTFGDGLETGGGAGGGGGQKAATAAPAVFQSALFTDLNYIATHATPEGQAMLKCLSGLNDQVGKIALPNVLAQVTYPDKTRVWALQEQMGSLKKGYVVSGTTTLENAKSQVLVPMADSTTYAVVLGELLGLFTPQYVAPATGADPSERIAVAAGPPPLPQPVFYIYDHLGNTRVTYHVDLTCPSTKTYVLDYAAEYYPYGKIMREYTNGPKEKYQTTQHERDQETGLDYRGARFYDSDVARFLSVDPMAAKYPEWSFYNYVMGNPLKFIDPDGKDTIVINRGVLNEELSDELTLVYNATLSLISNGVETPLALPDGSTQLYIFGDRFTGNNGYNALPNPVYKLTWKDMSTRTDEKNTGKQIQVYEGVFFHPGNDWGDFTGCKGICRTYEIREPKDYEKNIGATKVFYGHAIGETILKIKQLYHSLEGKLTGDKFILRTNVKLKTTQLNLGKSKLQYKAEDHGNPRAGTGDPETDDNGN